jgi:hypothetical protein
MALHFQIKINSQQKSVITKEILQHLLQSVQQNQQTAAALPQPFQQLYLMVAGM